MRRSPVRSWSLASSLPIVKSPGCPGRSFFSGKRFPNTRHRMRRARAPRRFYRRSRTLRKSSASTSRESDARMSSFLTPRPMSFFALDTSAFISSSSCFIEYPFHIRNNASPGKSRHQHAFLPLFVGTRAAPGRRTHQLIIVISLHALNWRNEYRKTGRIFLFILM